MKIMKYTERNPRVVPYYILAFLSLLLASSCTRTVDPPPAVGKQLPYTGGATKTLLQLLDSLPNVTLYKTAYLRSDLPAYIDSLRNGDSIAPYTLFVPTDAAFKAAGYSADSIQRAPVALLDTLVRYLAVTGNFPPPGNLLKLGGINSNPLMYPDPNLTRSQVPGVFNTTTPYFYTLNIAYSGNALLLNGRQVSAQAKAVYGTNGTIYCIDSLVTKPFYEIYQVLSMDTSFRFFMAALSISDSIYVPDILPWVDTSALVLSSSAFGFVPFSVVFAPDNNAFRKAGFQSIQDIYNYIYNSALVLGGGLPYDMTNMDSILTNHIMAFGLTGTGFGRSYIYTHDILADPSLAIVNQYTNTGVLQAINVYNISFQVNGSQITVHRQDFPGGRGADVIQPSDITTLNGVIHRVDNLLLPTP